MEKVPSPARTSPPFALAKGLRRFAVVGLLCVGALHPVVACMNDYKPNAVAIVRSNELIQQLRAHPTNEPWTERRDRLRKLLAEGGDHRVKNDLATTLAHTGEAAEAVKLLEEVEAEKPGLYFTAANLGTAYELSGDDHKALEWIRKGIERNPEAHDGTEWLHVRILEAKLAMAADPKWLESHSILDGRVLIINYGVTEREEMRNITGNRGELLTPEQVKAALIYQLHERLQFVPAPDGIVGVLLLNLADAVAAESFGSGGAADVLVLAQVYLKSLPLEQRLKDVEHYGAAARENQRLGDPERQQKQERESLRNFLVFVLGVGPLLSMLVIRWKRRIERQIQTPLKASEPSVPVHETHS